MCHMIFSLLLLIITFSKAEEFLKCSAVGKSNQKCIKDFYPDQEAQESNFLNPYDDEHPYQDNHNEPTQEFNTQSHQYSDQEQFLNGQEYAYGYTVNDVATGDQKFHRESRHDNVVHGTYSLIEPDGSKRTVVYTADDVHGFHAYVYRNEADHVDNIQNFEGYNDENTHASNSPTYNTETDRYSPSEQPGLADFIYGKDPNYQAQNTGTNPLSNSHESIEQSRGQMHFSVTPYDSQMVHYDPGRNLNGQTPQNIQILVENAPVNQQTTSYGLGLQDSNSEILNELGRILGEQNFVDSSIRDTENHAAMDNLALPTNQGEGYRRESNSIAQSTTPNPILAQLRSEIVVSHVSHRLDQNRDGLADSPSKILDTKDVSFSFNSVQGLANTISPTFEPRTVTTSRNIPQDTVTNGPGANTDIQPTSYSPLDINTQISSHFVDNSLFNASAVVENPHNIVTTPVPTTTQIPPLRLNPLDNGEFPLLAHASPSYARRYARQYA